MRLPLSPNLAVAISIAIWLLPSGWGPLRAATGTIQDVQHVVIFAQENRSFDQYLGSWRAVRGFDDRSALQLQNGNKVFHQPDGTNDVIPFHTSDQCVPDVEHFWGTLHGAWNSGRMDQWAAMCGESSMMYYTRADLPFYYALADSYTVCDAYHCSVLGPSNPNRFYLMTGTIDPNGQAGGPVFGNDVPEGGFTWPTYPERLQAAGISWRVYQQSGGYFPQGNALSSFHQFQTAQPGNPLYDRGMTLVSDLVGSFAADVTNGQLPQISWIIPPYDYSEHPPYSPANGEYLTSQLLQALAADPATLNSTVFILTYDEAGGFFDHVPPPVPPPGTADETYYGTPFGPGSRLPTIIVSPWTRGGHVCSQVFDHTSTIRFLEQWTGVIETNISVWRRQVCGDLTSAFDFANPDYTFPTLPNVSPISCPGASGPVPLYPNIVGQEPGPYLPRPLPYQPNATISADCGGLVTINMLNGGTTSTHFSIYPNAYRTDGPWQYDVAAGNSSSDSFDVVTKGSGMYDLTCYGPNGFLRRFAGNLSLDCEQVEVTSALDIDAGAVVLMMQNSTAADVNITVTNGYSAADPLVYTVPSGTLVSESFPAVSTNNGLYDLTATSDNDPTFLRRFVGHIEVGPLWLSFTNDSVNLIVNYPGWASSYTLEGTPDLIATNWQPVTPAPVLASSRFVATIPMTNASMYFRLRN